MIILEFRLQDHFLSASTLLETCKLPFEFETAQDPWRPNLIWLFEESVRTESQREGLVKARRLEKVDHFLQKQQGTLNLAVPQ